MEIKKNLANFFSLSRIILTPLMLYFAFIKLRYIFLSIAVLGLVTDVLDGLIARILKIESDFGRKLDSYADWLFYPMVLVCWIVFFQEFVLKNLFLVILTIVLEIFPYVFALLRLKRIPALHLRTHQIGVHFFFIFIITSLLFDPNRILFFLLAIWTFVICAEQIVFYSLIKEEKQERFHSVFALLKDLKKQDSGS